MPIQTRTCLRVTCDVCGEPLTDADEEAALHFDSAQDARMAAHGYRWTVLPAGRLICDSGNTAHQAALDALMPPEPTVVPAGQLTLNPDAEEAPMHERDVQAWNAQHPVGTPVLAYPGTREGRALTTKTRSQAWLVGHSPVVLVDGYSGGIALTHIDVITEETDQ